MNEIALLLLNKPSAKRALKAAIEVRNLLGM